MIASFDPSPVQLLASEEYQSSKRVSVYLSMPTEVDTEPVLKVCQLKNAQNCPELTLSFTVGHFQQWEVSGWFFTFISQRSRLMNTIFSLSLLRLCFVPRYEGPNMDMLRVHSLEDCNSLPKTKWNIRQPEGEA